MKSTTEVLAELRELAENLEAHNQSSLFRNEATKIGVVREAQVLRDAIENIESAWKDRDVWKSTVAALMGQKARAWSVMDDRPHDLHCESLRLGAGRDYRPEVCDCWKADLKAALKWEKEDSE